MLVFCLGYPWLSLPSSQGCEGIILLRVSSGWSSDCAGLASCGRPGKPSGVGLDECVPWLCVSLQLTLSP